MDDGVAGISSRIADIRARFTEVPANVAGAGGSGTSADAFAAVLASELAGADVATSSGADPLGLGSMSYGSRATDTAGTAPSTGAGGLVPAERLAPGDYGRFEPPAELVGYGNGRIPAEALAPIGVGQHRLWAPAARAFRQMRQDAAAQGVTIGVTDSYRDYGTQVGLAARKGLYSQGGLAATPGTSNHGWGMALDLDLDASAQRWMREHAWRYGFAEDTPREPWHWGYRPASAASPAGPSTSR